MSTYTSSKYGLTAANGDDPIQNGDNQMRGLADATDLALANMDGLRRLIADRAANSGGISLASGSTYVFAGVSSLGVPGASLSAYSAMYLDPADYTANSRTAKYRLRAYLITNAVAPTSTFTVGLYPVSAFGGASGSNPSVASLGSVVAGSTCVFTAPGAASATAVDSGDFTAPAAGPFVLAVAVTTASMAANSQIDIRARLQARQV